ncbi:hypothetical protein [Paraburkholderia sp. C35]|uniref:hypothetical protein n=1 Tax=Paraburkholderia sp. C35 TaxID=2126993 RepID=UPI000D698473|nr:hypothetical protein [Paraburkholderia sp. C35]
MTFNPKKPHGIVYGVTGVAYEQDGKYYSPAGEVMTLPKDENQKSTQAQTKPQGVKNVAS